MTENKTIAFLQKKQCTGCMLCGDCCPKAAISFYEDSEGFKYPKVDEATCISCGICVKNCPALSPLKNDSAENSFAVFATDESKREAGSSGGVFGLLAEDYQFPYYFGFQKYITLRPSCYQCKWACPERAGDITLGDYWGIEKYASELNAKEGVSMILCNTDAGKSLFQNLVNSGKVSAVTLPIQCAINENGCLKNPSKEKAERKLFFQHLQEWDFDKVVQVHLTPKKKWIFDLYYGMPKALRNVVRKLMDKRMKYE